MGRNRSLVNAYAGYILRFYPARWVPFSVVAEVSVGAGDRPQSNPAACQENEHYTAQSGKCIPIQRHLRRACPSCQTNKYRRGILQGSRVYWETD